MGKIIYSQVTAFRVLNYAPNGTPVILVQWTRSDWNNSGETQEHIAWEYGDWVKVLLKTIGAKDVVEAKGMEIRIDIDKSGWMKRIGNATSDMWWSPSDWFDPALSKAVEAWN